MTSSDLPGSFAAAVAPGPVDRDPYDGLAAIYDYVMRHVDYVEWAGYVRSLLELHGRGVRRLAELACGTGNAALELHRLGYEVAGSDGSPAMVRMARSKAAALTRDITFDVRDLRDLGDLGPVDAAVCLYDSFNYLLDQSDVDAALAEVGRVLIDGGLFIFDVCTEQNSLRYFRDVRDAETGPGFVYSRHSYYDREHRLQFNAFEIRFDEGELQVRETHSQHIYRCEELMARIDASSLELLAAYDGFTLRPGSEQSDRVHFVLRRPAAAPPP
ncbi:MAG: class I SAM-dependent methyltransferase [Gemmatimonadota bacterium]